MVKEMTKTNVMRILEAASVPFRTAEYKVDESDLSGVHAAAEMDMPADQVFKTLVLEGDAGHIVCVIPVAEELDLKLVARESGAKRVEMIPMKDLIKVTGYMRGGCSPIGMKKKFPTFIDETCVLWDEIAVSAGMRGEQIILSPDDLANITEAKICPLTAVK